MRAADLDQGVVSSSATLGTQRGGWLRLLFFCLTQPPGVDSGTDRRLLIVLTKTSTSTRLLELTTAILGSDAEVRKALQCTEADLASWRDGITEPPWTVFERMLDIVLDYQAKDVTAKLEALRKARDAK